MGPISSPAPGFSWNELSEQTECGPTDPSECPGFYGFTVLNDGSYLVGPTPDGSVKRGLLTAGEFSMLNRDASLLAGEELGSEYTCDSSQYTPGIQDNIGVLFPGDTSGTVVFQGELATQGSNCYLGAGPNALQLHSDMHALLSELYPVPFPSASSPSPSPSVQPSPSPSPTSSGTDEAIQTGTWGGEHVQLKETKKNATFTFDCATGQIQAPILVDSNGYFSMSGSYTLQNGPISSLVPHERSRQLIRGRWTTIR